VAKRPEDRFQTPAELATALTLGNAAQVEPVPVIQHPVAQPDSPWDSLTDDGVSTERAAEPTAFLVAPGRATTVAMPPARPRVPWRLLALVGAGLVLAAVTITAVVVYRTQRNTVEKDSPSSSPVAKASPQIKSHDPPDVQHNAKEEKKSKEAPNTGAKQPTV